MMLRWMAARSMARLSASRTRLSANGFLPFTLLCLSSGLPMSGARKMVRTSGPFSTFRRLSRERRSRSCTGTSVSRSTSPASRAATRVASALIGV